MRHNDGQGECRSRAKCNQTRCNESKPHARDLCPLNFKQTVSVQFCPDLVQENVNSLVTKAQRAVTLSSATFNCLNPEVMHLSPDKRVDGVLLDNAAQRSLISKECAQRLCIKVIRKDRINLLSYGSKVPESNLFEIVSICLGRNDKHRPVTFEALVVKSINPICMAGASGFAKKLENKGFCLADDRLVRTKSDFV